MNENEISKIILDVAFKLHTDLGPGLLESAYKNTLCHLLQQKGLKVQTEKPIPLNYKDTFLECGYRADLLIENKVIVELKSVENLNDLHFSQVLTYLKIGKYKLGLLINFNVIHLKEGIRRVVNGL